MKKIFLVVLGIYPFVGAIIKSVPVVSNVPSVYFDKTAYAVVDDQPMLFLGSATELTTTNPAIMPNETNFTLARLVLENNNETEQVAVVQSLTPAKVTLNGVANQDNQLLTKKVKHLGLYKNSYPIVVPETPATNASPTSNQFFCCY
ncbi:MAG: hypothetical protein IPP67_03705 [Rhodospirillaceae bacterium]|nr:hypothetical protein [Rhodospirillaceae bacterium]